MKFRIGPHPDEGAALTVTVRDGPSGRDKETASIEPGGYQDFEFDRDDVVVIAEGAAVAQEPEAPAEPQEPDENAAPETLQVSNPTVEETVRATAFEQAKAGGASNEEALAAADAIQAPVDPETQQVIGEEPADDETVEEPAAEPEATAEPEQEATAETDGEGQTAEVGGEQAADAAQDPRDPTDEEIADIIRGLETSPSAERTQTGYIQHATLNEALEAKGFKTVDTKRRKEVSERFDLVKKPS